MENKKTLINQIKEVVGKSEDKLVGMMRKSEEKITGRLSSLEANQDKTICKILNIETYIQEELVTKNEFDQKFGGLANQIEGFVKLHEKLDHEHVSLCSNVKRIDRRLIKTENQLSRN